MINTMSKIYRREIFLSSLAAICFLWSVSSTILALRNKPSVTIIGIDKAGAYVIDNETTARVSLTTTFIRYFLILFFSHDKYTFSTNTDIATNLMSESLFRSFREKISESKKEAEKYSQFAEVLSVSLVDSNKYEAHLRMKYLKESSESSEDFKVTLSVSEAPFVMENPWGYEVTHLEESRIN